MDAEHGKGESGEALGASYQAERRPVAQRNVAQATGNREVDYCAYSGAVLDADTPEGAQLRAQLGAEIIAEKTSQFVSHGIALGYCYDTSPIVAGDGTEAPPLTVGTYVPTTYPGARAPHAWIDENTSTIDIFGKGFVLMNFTGEAAGAGLKDHIHQHIVPRWNGDTNFMPVLSGTRVMPQALMEQYDVLYPLFNG